LEEFKLEFQQVKQRFANDLPNVLTTELPTKISQENPVELFRTSSLKRIEELKRQVEELQHHALLQTISNLPKNSNVNSSPIMATNNPSEDSTTMEDEGGVESLVVNSTEDCDDEGEEDYEEDEDPTQSTHNDSSLRRIVTSEIFSEQAIHREMELESKYTKQIDYLMRQIEVCDLKTVQYRIQYQQAIIDLEKAQENEEKLKLSISHIQEQLNHAHDDLQTAKFNYENQIQLLSDKLADMTIKYNIDSSRTDMPASSGGQSSGAISGLVSSFFVNNETSQKKQR